MAPKWMKAIVRQVKMFLSKLKTSIIWVSSESANAGDCKSLSFWSSWIDTNLTHQMVVSSANRKDKNEIVPCMVDKPINHLLKLLESCTAPLAIITTPFDVCRRYKKW